MVNVAEGGGVAVLVGVADGAGVAVRVAVAVGTANVLVGVLVGVLDHPTLLSKVRVAAITIVQRRKPKDRLMP
jgi:hypothetical protein